MKCQFSTPTHKLQACKEQSAICVGSHLCDVEQVTAVVLRRLSTHLRAAGLMAAVDAAIWPAATWVATCRLIVCRH